MIKHPSIPLVSLGPDIPKQAREWRNTPEIRKWCRQYSLISEDNQSDWLNDLIDDRSIKMFSIDVEGRPVGVCGLTSIDRVNQRAEFSMYIAPKEQRKGYGKKALILLMMHGFNDQNLNRIWGESFDGNPAMILFKELGFGYEGRQKEAYFREGKFIDSHIVAITRSEFNELYSNRSCHSDQRVSRDCEPVRVDTNHDGSFTYASAPAPKPSVRYRGWWPVSVPNFAIGPDGSWLDYPSEAADSLGFGPGNGAKRNPEKGS